MKKKADQNGFTLMELLIALAVSSIIMAVIASTYFYYSRMSVKQEKVLEVTQKLRATIYVLERDFYMAGFDSNPADSQDSGFLKFDATDISFTTLDGEVLSTFNYKVQGSAGNYSLLRDDIVLCDNIKEITFWYYVLENNKLVLKSPPAASDLLDDIKGVRIKLSVESSDKEVLRTLETDVYCRNL